MKPTIIAAAVLALAVPAAAQAAPARHKHRTHVVHRSVPRAQQQIACTAIGCVPVPPGCGQTPGHSWSGMPTGNDIIVCPPGIAPFR